MALGLFIAALFGLSNTGSTIFTFSSKLHGSQLPWRSAMHADYRWPNSSVDPRVQVPARNTWEASADAAAKQSGSITSFTIPWIRKRAYRRARGRAAREGGTWYRGEWRTARSLGVNLRRDTAGEARIPTARRTSAVSQGRKQRLRVLTYNIGGMSADLFDVFTEWLDEQTIADVIVLQETHHGLGKADSIWTRGSWHFVASGDPDARFAGACICISARLVSAASLEHRVIIPGRLVHVRIQGGSLPIDVVGVYQWVRHSRTLDGNAANRSRLWTSLGRLLASLPKRNVLAVAGDLNTSCSRLDVHVGSGVLTSPGPMDAELVDVLRTHDLCLLNTWGSARPGLNATFINGKMRTQIDYIATRRTITDPQARMAKPLCLDLAPWRQGPKHRPVLGSVPWVGPWQMRNQQEQRVFRYSLPELREWQRANPAKWDRFCEAVHLEVRRMPDMTRVSALNQVVLRVCKLYFPLRRTSHAQPAGKPELKPAIAHMWNTYHQWRHSQRSRNARGNIFKVWRSYTAFRTASKELRRASVQARRQRLHEVIARAANAAARDQMSELYRITKMLAPKQRRERVVIRSKDGQMLNPEQQFQSILQYFQQAFSDPTPFWFSPDSPAPVITPAEFQAAITYLQPRKAVPVNSVPPEVWKACPELFASCLARDYAREFRSSRLNTQAPSLTVVSTFFPSLTKLPASHKTLGL